MSATWKSGGQVSAGVGFGWGLHKAERCNTAVVLMGCRSTQGAMLDCLSVLLFNRRQTANGLS